MKYLTVLRVVAVTLFLFMIGIGIRGFFVEKESSLPQTIVGLVGIAGLLVVVWIQEKIEKGRC